MLFVGLSTTALAQTISAPIVVAAGRQVTVTWTSSFPGSSEIAWGPVSASGFGGYPSIDSFGAGTLQHSRTLRELPAGPLRLRVRTQSATASVESPELVVDVPEEPRGGLSFEGRVLAIAPVGTTWFIGGDFVSIGPATGTLAPFDATTGRLLPQFPEADGPVSAIVADGDGGFYVGGSFMHLGGLPRPGVAHLLADLGVDPDFVVPVQGAVRAIAIGPQAIYLGGAFVIDVGGVPRSNLVAVQRNGAPVMGWVGETDTAVEALAIAGARLFIGGEFNGVNGATRARLTALAATTGVLDTDFARLDAPVHALQIIGNTLYVGGAFTMVGTTARSSLAAFDLGTLALKDLNVVIDGPVFALEPSAAGMYVGGFFNHVGMAARSSLAEISLATGIPSGFTPTDNNGAVYGLSASNGSLYVARSEAQANGAARNYAIAYSVNGAMLPWDPDLSGVAYAVRAASGVVLVGGAFSTANARTRRSGLAAIDVRTGALLPFDAQLNAYARVRGLLVNDLGLFAGGDFFEARNAPASNLASFDPLTGARLGWAPAVDGDVRAMQPVGTGAVLIGGAFTAVNGQARGNLASLSLGDGALLPFTASADGPVEALATPDGGLFYVGGSFSTLNTRSRMNLGAVDVNGLPPVTFWNQPTDGRVSAIAMSPSGVVVGGAFTRAGSSLRRNVVLINEAGTVQPWAPNPDQEVLSVAASPNAILLGGGFTLAAEVPVRFHAAFDARAPSFPGPFDVAPTDWVDAVFIDCANRVVGIGTRAHGMAASGHGGLGLFAATDAQCPPLADAGLPVDAGLGDDAGLPTDAGLAMDAGAAEDAGSGDAGLALDAGLPPDAGSAPSGRYDVGCGCTSAPAAPLVLLWFLLRKIRAGAVARRP